MATISIEITVVDAKAKTKKHRIQKAVADDSPCITMFGVDFCAAMLESAADSIAEQTFTRMMDKKE